MTTPNVAPTETPAPAAPAAPATNTEATSEESLMTPEVKVEPKPAEQPKVDPKVDPKADDKPAAPEAPKPIELKLPDGVKVAEPVLHAFKEFATANKLSPEQAQAALDWQLSQNAAQQKAYSEQAQKQSETWLAELKADKEIGGDKWNASLADHKAGKAWLGDDFAKLMHSIGIGNHPALAKAVIKIGKANREDSIRATATAPAEGAAEPFHKTAYPSMQKKEKDS